jgi:hypothetical protein
MRRRRRSPAARSTLTDLDEVSARRPRVNVGIGAAQTRRPRDARTRALAAAVLEEPPRQRPLGAGIGHDPSRRRPVATSSRCRALGVQRRPRRRARPTRCHRAAGRRRAALPPHQCTGHARSGWRSSAIGPGARPGARPDRRAGVWTVRNARLPPAGTSRRVAPVREPLAAPHPDRGGPGRARRRRECCQRAG